MVAIKLITKYRKKLEKLREKNSYFEWEIKTEKILTEMLEEFQKKNKPELEPCLFETCTCWNEEEHRQRNGQIN